jgi:putative OPT family oligopeptide transporter
MSLSVIFLICVAIMFGLYDYLIGSLGASILTTFIMIVISFFIVAVASYICGLVGSSNSPVSGMTISALMGTAALFIVLGYRGESAILATLGVAAVVCCAACTSGDCSQDLKTGLLLGATPRSQQIAQIIGVVIPAFVIAPVLTLLHHTYVIGSAKLNAPQATLFTSITNGLFGSGDLPYDMVYAGAAIGVAIIVLDLLLKRIGTRFRLHLMPLAVGIYLPISLGVVIFLGGLVREIADRGDTRESDRGVLLSSGLIAGEAITGVLLAVVMYFQFDLHAGLFGEGIASAIGVVVLAGLAWFMLRTARGNNGDV